MPFDDPSSPGIPGVFVFMFVLFALIAVGGFFVRLSIARSMARRAGLDEDAATATTMFDQHGLAATYIASAMAESAHAAAPRTRAAAPESRSEQRLRELKQLLDDGLISQAEYDERRRTVLDSI